MLSLDEQINSLLLFAELSFIKDLSRCSLLRSIRHGKLLFRSSRVLMRQMLQLLKFFGDTLSPKLKSILPSP